MINCDYCGSSILFGGINENNLHFCNKECYTKGSFLLLTYEISDDLVNEKVNKTYHGRGLNAMVMGLLMFIRHIILIITSWCNQPQICCRSCEIKSQLSYIIFSFLCGWWGVPWGFIYTPVQIVRNIMGIVRGPNKLTPSAELEKLIRINIASDFIENQEQVTS